MITDSGEFIEEDKIKNAKINYQMLQTLTNITDDEIELLTHKSSERITNVCNSKETMMDILGITPYNTNMTPFQKAVKLYPPLLLGQISYSLNLDSSHSNSFSGNLLLI